MRTSEPPEEHTPPIVDCTAVGLCDPTQRHFATSDRKVRPVLQVLQVVVDRGFCVY